MKKLIYLIGFLLLASCGQPYEIETDYISIVIPESWDVIEKRGIDSSILIIVTNNQDTIVGDYGLFSQSFEETVKVFSKEQIRKYDSLNMDTESLKYSRTPEIDQNQGVFLNDYYYYELIDKNLGKVRVPKKFEEGQIGISFRNINGSENHFTLLGKGLNLENQKELLKLFKTIKFKTQ